ncbi:glycosyltransferase [Cellulomonas xylanilytica]|uniref:D-inositol 3-phosphate glycosyltransferase n=1 Tax=Cellulomonas xylanilytica TaxID=233583 RepID=A0A510V3N2_9CELL|nr:glycosyltransferase [Cellulomonas xylanilytica]GEK21489.1 glycosyl transferase [Cellulomonas xylanilytica]
MGDRQAPRVLHVTQPTDAGVAAVVHDLAIHQHRHGVDVAVACAGPLAARLRSQGVPVVDWSARRSPVRGLRTEAVSLRSILAAWTPDVVHLHSSKAGLVGRLVLRGRTQTLFQPHAWGDEAVRWPVSTAVRAWERYADRWTNVTICVSDAEAQRAAALGVDTVRTVHNGIDVSRWQPVDSGTARRTLGLPANAFVVACVGRLCRQKGQDVLVAAWQRARSSLPAGAVLVLVGDGPWRERLAADASDHVRLVGAVTDPRDWYAAADLVVMPSRWEGAALVPLEAMAMGRAVVGSAVGGFGELVEDEEAALVPDDVDLLAEALVRFARDGDRRQRLAVSGRAHVLQNRSADESLRATTEITLTVAGQGARS